MFLQLHFNAIRNFAEQFIFHFIISIIIQSNWQSFYKKYSPLFHVQIQLMVQNDWITMDRHFNRSCSEFDLLFNCSNIKTNDLQVVLEKEKRPHWKCYSQESTNWLGLFLQYSCHCHIQILGPVQNPTTTVSMLSKHSHGMRHGNDTFSLPSSIEFSIYVPCSSLQIIFAIHFQFFPSLFFFSIRSFWLFAFGWQRPSAWLAKGELNYLNILSEIFWDLMFDIFFIFKFCDNILFALIAKGKRLSISINSCIIFFFLENVQFKEKKNTLRDESENSITKQPFAVPFGGSVKYLLFRSNRETVSTNRVKVWKPQRKVKTNRMFI